jgi:zinc transport system permease protein
MIMHTAIPMTRRGMDDFLVLSLIAGIGVALVAGPLGCFVVWRRMSYFGATLSHSALLGVALGILFDVNAMAGIIAVCLGVALMLTYLERDPRFAADTILGILAHGALALGLVVISFMETVRLDLMGYLFGDILSVTTQDLIWIYGGGLICLAMLWLLWRPLLIMAVQEDLAQVEGVAVGRTRLLFMVTIAFVIAVAMKVVGVLLIVSMLIIPAAIARRFATTPEQMAVMAALAGCFSVAGGLFASATIDTPAGPSIVVVATMLFFLTLWPANRTVQGL